MDCHSFNLTICEAADKETESRVDTEGFSTGVLNRSNQYQGVETLTPAEMFESSACSVLTHEDSTEVFSCCPQTSGQNYIITQTLTSVYRNCQ